MPALAGATVWTRPAKLIDAFDYLDQGVIDQLRDPPEPFLNLPEFRSPLRVLRFQEPLTE